MLQWFVLLVHELGSVVSCPARAVTCTALLVGGSVSHPGVGRTALRPGTSRVCPDMCCLSWIEALETDREAMQELFLASLSVRAGSLVVNIAHRISTESDLVGVCVICSLYRSRPQRVLSCYS